MTDTFDWLLDTPLILVLGGVNVAALADRFMGDSLGVAPTLYSQFGLFSICGALLAVVYYFSVRWGRLAVALLAAANILLSVLEVHGGWLSSIGGIATNVIILAYNAGLRSRRVLGGGGEIQQVVASLEDRLTRLEKRVKALEEKGVESRVTTSFDVVEV